MKYELAMESFVEQRRQWPTDGRHILAHFDNHSVVVYQAYSPEIAEAAVADGFFAHAPGYNLDRMTWIKPGFLWMMHRSGWASKTGQERILAIWLDRVGIDAILRKAVPSSFNAQYYGDIDNWKQAVGSSSVRVQWDPDYTPDDVRVERRALQIGLRGKVARHYAHGGWILHIEDITDLVLAQKAFSQQPFTQLELPVERVYPLYDPELAIKLGVG